MRAAGAARLVASLTVVFDQMKIQAAGTRVCTHWNWDTLALGAGGSEGLTINRR